MTAHTQCAAVLQDLTHAVESIVLTNVTVAVRVDELAKGVKSADRGLLLRNAAGKLIDVWGRPLLVTCEQSPDEITVRVASAGRDGTAGTDDDVALCRVRDMGTGTWWVRAP